MRVASLRPNLKPNAARRVFHLADERNRGMAVPDNWQHHCKEVVMGSGAYSVFIDHEAPGGGPPGSLRRVVPLPPPELSGGVQFTTVVLSLAYDNFGQPGAPATIPATVRVLRGSGPVQTLNLGANFFTSSMRMTKRHRSN